MIQILNESFLAMTIIISAANQAALLSSSTAVFCVVVYLYLYLYYNDVIQEQGDHLSAV